MRILLALLPVHLLVYLGLRQRELGEAASLGSIFQSLLGYPLHMWQTLVGGDMVQLLVGLPSTGVYFTLAGLLAWPTILLLQRLPAEVRWFLGSLPGFFLLTLAIFVIFWLAAVFRFFTPLEPGQPWVIAVLTLALLLPPSARVAHYLELRRLEYSQSDFTRTARSIGLSEGRVQAKAARVALSEGVSLLAGEAFGLVVATMLLEGLLQFPGLGLSVYNILASGGAVEGLNLGVQMPATQASGGLLLLLLMAGVYAVLVETLARRLDPRNWA